MKITLKQKNKPERRRMITGRTCYFPASYDIYADGNLVGELRSWTQTRIRDGGHGHKAFINGQKLENAAARGEERKRMEQEIREILEKRDV